MLLMHGAATWPTYVEALATALAAVGTVAAVCVVLFFQPLREEQQKPRLVLKKPNGGAFGVPATHKFLHTLTLAVEAKKGRKSAEDVEILATARWSVPERPDDEPVTQFESRPLPWYESDETDGPVGRMHIAPGMSRQVEILKAGSPEAIYSWMGWPRTVTSYVPEETVAFAIPPRPSGPGSRGLVQDYLDWQIRFDVTARDIDTVSYVVDLKVKTTWEPLTPGESGTKPSTWADLTGRRVQTDIRWKDFRQLSA